MDSNYRQALIKLENDLKKVNGDDEEYELLDTFAMEYMMPWQFWKKLLRNTAYEDSGDVFAKILSLYPLSFQQKNLRALHNLKSLCIEMNNFSEEVENIKYNYHSLNKETFFPTSVKSLIRLLKYPHADVEEIWEIYLKNSCSIPLNGLEETAIKMSALYEKMKNGGANDSEIFEAESEEYIQYNVVKNLGEDLCNQKLWKLYINFVKTKTDKEFLLQTYSNYCRFFLDDNEMKKEYQKAVEEFGPSKVAWKNLFDFEEKKKDFNVKLFMFKKENDFVDCMENAFDLKKPFPGIKFSYRGILQQRFPFHQNFMRYIWDKANPQIRQKLLNTCKYFFAKHPYPICYKLCLDICDEDENSNEEIVQQSLKVVYDENDDDTLESENLWITDVLIAINKVYDSETISLAQFIPRIYRCDAKCVDIRKQVLTLDELKFLIGHGNVEDLNLANNFIINDEDGNEVALEDIAKMVPKIKFFDVASPILTATTFSTIANLTFQNKILSMTLVKIEEELEAEAFGKFITKNFTSGSKIELYFEIEQELVLNFKQILEIAVNNHWKVEEDRPELYILQGMDGMYSYV